MHLLRLEESKARGEDGEEAGHQVKDLHQLMIFSLILYICTSADSNIESKIRCSSRGAARWHLFTKGFVLKCQINVAKCQRTQFVKSCKCQTRSSQNKYIKYSIAIFELSSIFCLLWF